MIYRIGLCFAGAVVAAAGWLAADRVPPYTALEYAATDGPPLGAVTLVGRVVRDVDRDCEVTAVRYMDDAIGRRYLMSGPQYFSPAAARALNARSPGVVQFTAVVPGTATPGDAKHVVDLTYVCNPTHRVWPVRLTVEYAFRILPGSAAPTTGAQSVPTP